MQFAYLQIRQRLLPRHARKQGTAGSVFAKSVDKKRKPDLNRLFFSEQFQKFNRKARKDELQKADGDFFKGAFFGIILFFKNMELFFFAAQHCLTRLSSHNQKPPTEHEQTLRRLCMTLS